MEQYKNDIQKWVEESAALTQPDKIYWCDGSKEEFNNLMEQAIKEGIFLPLNSETYPNCYLHRSHPSDVARTEHLTYVCTSNREDAGPNNNWMDPKEAKDKVGNLFRGSMKGRTMYVIPYLMGPAGSPYSRVGVEITDSLYVVLSMHIMTRVGKVALEHYEKTKTFVPGLHSLGDLSPERRFIMHFPEEQLIWSVGSGYGGNALLGKKCFSLRIASWIARQEGWLAEHMLIIGVEDPEGKITYIAAAFPSASGKTNFAMMIPTIPGYKVWTVGDDIAWMFIDRDGYLRAINPEAGMFGVAPGTGPDTNPIAMEMLKRNSFFTNVGLTPKNEPWWEGIGTEPMEGILNWRGELWKNDGTPIAHPNSRFTTPLNQCPIISPHWEDPEGVPISAIVFGTRRSTVVPLVFQAFNWQHGVFVGSSMAAETTAAAVGSVGVKRRDPMAMLPFCGYNMGDYFKHWLETGKRLKNPPLIFRVNWFRKDEDGNFLWPGFAENSRVVKWIIDRIYGKADAVETPIGYIPTENSINTTGLNIKSEAMKKLLEIDVDGWLNGVREIDEFYKQFGDRLPVELYEELQALEKRLLQYKK